jgi:hypothetical protein
VAKAFNCLDADLAVEKLSWYGIEPEAANFIRSYLTNRKQISLVNKTLSRVGNIDLGTPQGGSFSTTMYILYNNDFQQSTTLDCILFADDTTIMGGFGSEEELVKAGNNELEKVSKWFRANKLTLNSKKSIAAIFKPAGLTRKVSFSGKLKLNGQQVQILGEPEAPATVKFLGIHLDAKLKFNHHAAHVANKMRQGIFALNQAKNFLNEENRLKIYYALIQSHLDYGNLIWLAKAPQAAVTTIAKLQKRAIRLVKKSPYTAHTASMFRSLNVLKVEDAVKIESMNLEVMLKRHELPPGIVSLFERNQSQNQTVRSMRSDNTHYSESSTINNLTSHWGGLAIPKLNTGTIKKRNKTDLTKAYFNDCRGCGACQKADNPA